MDSDSTKKPVKPRGFASLSKEQLRVVSASGGRRAHAIGNAHRFTAEEARDAALRRHGLPPRPKSTEASDSSESKPDAPNSPTTDKTH